MASKGTRCEAGGPKPKKQRRTKVMTKKTRKTLQDYLKSLDVSILVSEAITNLNQEFSDSPLMCFVKEICKEQHLLQELVENHRQTFVTLHCECKKEKNSQMRFQLRWLEYCSAYLLEEKYTLAAIHLVETPELINVRQKWLDLLKKHTMPVLTCRSVMTSLSSAVYNTLLEHVSSFQAKQGTAAADSVAPDLEEEGVYYRFGGGAICEMLQRRYKHIKTSRNKNLMSIEISMLQAINTKDKSDIPGYLQYRDEGFMYFPHKVFIPFLQKIDTKVKSLVNVKSLNEHGDNLIKVSHTPFVLYWIV